MCCYEYYKILYNISNINIYKYTDIKYLKIYFLFLIFTILLLKILLKIFFNFNQILMLNLI